MSYQALARKWRPKNFDQVIGQTHVVRALSNALDSQRIHHAFLFSGTRGVGKTTLARIFAKAINCLQGVSSKPCGQCEVCCGIDQGYFIDLIEVDAASRTKVDDTRDLLDNVQYMPTQGRYKVYLIDEVHMLSGHSFNALLKTLEEPPEHVKFLLATTDPQKLPLTILSRCIQFNLKALDLGMIAAHLEKVLDDEQIDYDSAATLILARSANGSVRDALSLLDQAIAFSSHNVDTDNVRAMLGMIDERFTVALLYDIANANTESALINIVAMVERSVDFAGALDELLSTLHNLALYHVSPSALEWKGLDNSPLHDLAKLLDPDWLQLLFQIGLVCKRDLPLAPDPRSGFEMAILRMICFRPDQSNEAGAERTTKQKNMRDKVPSNLVIEKVEKKTENIIESITRTQPHTKATSTTKVPKKEKKMKAETTKSDLSSLKCIEANTSYQGGLKDICRMENWFSFVKKAGFTGMQKALVANLAPRKFDGKQLKLDLDESAKHLLSTTRVRKIEQQCRDSLGVDICFKIVVKERSDRAQQTLAEVDAAQNEQYQKQAEQAFHHDQNVQELIKRFDAEIIPESITSPQQQTG